MRGFVRKSNNYKNPFHLSLQRYIDNETGIQRFFHTKDKSCCTNASDDAVFGGKPLLIID
jgi:hypothetical protein